MNVRRIVLAVFALALASVTAHAESNCRRVKSVLLLAASADPGCTSPVGLCATGSLRGSLAGHSSFIGSSFVSTLDTAATGVLVLTGDNTIHTRRGDLFTKDSIVLATTGAGEFAEVDTIVGGTGDFDGASGKLTATGTFANGAGEGFLEGEICQD